MKNQQKKNVLSFIAILFVMTMLVGCKEPNNPTPTKVNIEEVSNDGIECSVKVTPSNGESFYHVDMISKYLAEKNGEE